MSAGTRPIRPPAGEVSRVDAGLPGYATKHVEEKTSGRRTKAQVESRIALANPGWAVVAASIGLVILGAYSISLASGLQGEVGALTPLALKQLVFLAVGIVAAGVMAAVDYRKLIRFVPLLSIGTVALLVFVLIPFVPEFLVRPVNGARRWINLGVSDFQPSELAKVVFVLASASYLRWRSTHRTLIGLIIPAFIAFVPMGLILVEPDLGTALLFMPSLLAMLVAAGAKLVHVIGTCALGGVFGLGIVAASLFFAQAEKYPLLRPHQVERIEAVIDSWQGDERFVDSRGFQGRQAKMLLGAGGFAGHDEERARALINFSSLPERHNDMIFAVVLNRFGFVGSAIMLALYAVWFVGALFTAGVSKDPFGRIIVVGFVGMLATQAMINIGMTLGLLPITGMTLPFVSYGGSSLLMNFVMVGLILSVGLRRPERLWRDSFEFGATR